MTEASRRGFLMGIGSLLAAPAIVSAASLMPIRGLVMPTDGMVKFFTAGSLPSGISPGVYTCLVEYGDCRIIRRMEIQFETIGEIWVPSSVGIEQMDGGQRN